MSGGISPVFELGSGMATRASFPKAPHDLADLLRVAEACSGWGNLIEELVLTCFLLLLLLVCQPVQGNEGRSEATTEQQQQAAQQADNVEKTLRADLAVSVSKLLQKVYQPGQGSEGRIQSTVTTGQQQQHAAQQIQQPGRQDQTDQVQRNRQPRTAGLAQAVSDAVCLAGIF
ncbi:Hypp5442 [Branchiostoma lanceolatum]|uniref:Hypp5442 protein n=1 Tax=Branchiostoma lanceolatum TaxID=7740 RepID=A0A8J9WEX9_BRALA|nr:Hypp5442 [Branchiostoma lanceolatum]